jgi:bacterioferritin (cytochrome b1)
VTTSRELIEEIFELESHEVEELRILLRFTREASPEVYRELREPIKKLIKDTVTHIDDLHTFLDEIRISKYEG